MKENEQRLLIGAKLKIKIRLVVYNQLWGYALVFTSFVWRVIPTHYLRNKLNKFLFSFLRQLTT